MKKEDRADKIAAILDEHFPNPEIPLKHNVPYTLLIAVLLSARCTDARVNIVAPRLFAIADSPEAMILLSPKEIQEIIRPCGLSPAKSRAIWQLSKDLIEKHEARVPRTLEALESLPGVGRKTASVVLAQAFQIPAFPVDTHIFRSAHRWGLSRGKTPAAVEADLKRLFPQSKWIKIHLQIIHFARRFCPARGHVRESCPICSSIFN